MKKVTLIGVDLSKNVYQLHGAAEDGSVIFRKKLTRVQFAKFMAQHSLCLVAMEACSTSHYWARVLTAIGHSVRLIAPIYVKPFVKRQKNDAADAEAIVEAALRPNMRFVTPKSEDQQARAVLFRTREQLVSQRTAAINALRSHLAEFGFVAPVGIACVQRLANIVEDGKSALPKLARDMCQIILSQIAALSQQIASLQKRIRQLAGKSAVSNRLQTMPGVGPISAFAVEVFAPEMSEFRRGRDFSAWLGLVPKQHSTGGKQKMGRTSKMGQRDIRRLLIIGAMSVIRWAARRGAEKGSWLERMMARKPRMVVAIALANKMARGLWAMLVKEENYKKLVLAAQ
ncbi:MAG: IS110 family transposase [Planctomycetaceae bacterium]|nr:IS110 family transposase [Planctomycetaceae bacterium]